MNITINTVTSPNSCGHIHFTYTLGNGTTGTLDLLMSDFQLDPDDYVTALVGVMRNYLKTNNVTTKAGAKTALEGKTFQL